MARILVPILLPANVSMARAHALGRELVLRVRGVVQILEVEGIAQVDELTVADTYSVSLGRPEKPDRSPMPTSAAAFDSHASKNKRKP